MSGIVLPIHQNEAKTGSTAGFGEEAPEIRDTSSSTEDITEDGEVAPETYTFPGGYVMRVDQLELKTTPKNFILSVAREIHGKLTRDQQKVLTVEAVSKMDNVLQLAQARWNTGQTEFRRLREEAQAAAAARKKTAEEDALAAINILVGTELTALNPLPAPVAPTFIKVEITPENAEAARKEAKTASLQDRLKRIRPTLQELPEIVFLSLYYALAFRGILCRSMAEVKKMEQNNESIKLLSRIKLLLSKVHALLGNNGYQVEESLFRGKNPKLRATLEQRDMVMDAINADGRFTDVIKEAGVELDTENGKPVCPKCRLAKRHLYVVGTTERLPTQQDAKDAVNVGEMVGCLTCIKTAKFDKEWTSPGPMPSQLEYDGAKLVRPKPNCATEGCTNRVKSRKYKLCPQCTKNSKSSVPKPKDGGGKKKGKGNKKAKRHG